MKILRIDNQNRVKYHSYSNKISNNVNFKNDENTDIKSAVKTLTTKEANTYLKSDEGKKFVGDLFFRTCVEDLEPVVILHDALEKKKKEYAEWKKWLHHLAENEINQTFLC